MNNKNIKRIMRTVELIIGVFIFWYIMTIQEIYYVIPLALISAVLIAKSMQGYTYRELFQEMTSYLNIDA